jgi:hypothetical protein
MPGWLLNNLHHITIGCWLQTSHDEFRSPKFLPASLCCGAMGAHTGALVEMCIPDFRCPTWVLSIGPNLKPPPEISTKPMY